MTEIELLERLRAGEGPFCEWKASAKSDEIREAVVAFANSVRTPNVGILFLGVKPDGSPSGNVTDPDKTQRDVRRHLEACYPRVERVELYPLRVGAANIVAVVVPESRNGPHFTGPAFVRVGSQNTKASAAMFEELIADRTQAARLLRPWKGQVIHVQREHEPVKGRRSWESGVAPLRLVDVDAIGLALEHGGGLLTADWSRVKLQSIRSGEPPLVRIQLD